MDYARFAALAAEAEVVPVWREVLLDTDTPVAAFAKLRRGPFAFLLESAPAGGETWARYTILGTEPSRAWRISDDRLSEWTPDGGWTHDESGYDPLGELAKRTGLRAAMVPELGAFWGGVIGYLAYDVARSIERLPSPPARVLPLPDACFVETRTVVVIDNLHGRARIVVSVRVPSDADDGTLRMLYTAAHDDIDAIVARLHERSELTPLDVGAREAVTLAETSGRYSRAQFLHDVDVIKEHIRAGDCFQALLARRIETPFDFDSTDLYRALRAINPSPYMFHLVLDDVELVGCSPELLVRVADGRVTVRPIAGTRRRGATDEEDARLRDELLADEKERAEHVMLVDLGRNDVGRVAEYGTVAVTELMQVEKYSHVLHIVSQVEGRMRPGLGVDDALRATFPAGTMTGAPKVRAMQIIDSLEPERRGAYAGALGYVGWGGTRADLAITIRTCVIAGGVASVQAGAGIIADSVPESEWAETENKARAVLTAIAQVRAARAREHAGHPEHAWR